MCSEYQLHTSPEEVAEELDQPVINKAKNFNWDSRIGFFREAPVVQKNKDGELEFALKIFPTKPMPNSRLSGLEGQTEDSVNEVDHRQIKRIYEMKLWKDGFAKHPLLIPMTEFTEFAYWGKKIGSALSFTIPKNKVMFAAGLAIKPFTPEGPPHSGFSIITHTATEQMFDYHHRLIVLLESHLALGYLEEMTPQDRFNYIIENRYLGDFDVHKIRNMAKGWEKKVDRQQHKLNQELKYREVLKQNNVPG